LYFVAVQSIVSFLLDAYGGDDTELFKAFQKRAQEIGERITDLLTTQMPEDGPQHESATLSHGLRLLAFLLSVFGGIIPATKDSLGRFSTVFTRATKNLKDMHYMQETFYDFFYGDQDETEVSEAIATAEEALQNIRGLSFAAQVDTHPRMQELLRKNRALLDRAHKHKSLRSSSMTSRLARAVDKLSDLEAALSQALDYRAAIRPLPVTRHFCGLPAAGKTTMVREELVPRLMNKLGWKTPTNTEMYTPSQGSSYFPGYTNQRFLIFDEFLAQGWEDPFLTSFNALATDQETLIDGAAIEFKNMRPNHEFLFTISNSSGLAPRPDGVQAGFCAAVNSRLNTILVHWPGFQEGAGRNPGIQRHLCLHRVRTNAAIPARHRNCPCARDTVADDRITIDQLVEEMVAEHRANQVDYQRRLAAFDTAQAAVHEALRGSAEVIRMRDMDADEVEYLRAGIATRYPDIHFITAGNFSLKSPEKFSVTLVPEDSDIEAVFMTDTELREHLATVNTDFQEERIRFEELASKPFIPITGKTPEEIMRWCDHIGITFSMEEKRVFRAARSGRPAVVDTMCNIIYRGLPSTTPVVLSFVDLNVMAFRAGSINQHQWHFFIKKGHTRFILRGPSNFMEEAYDAQSKAERPVQRKAELAVPIVINFICLVIVGYVSYSLVTSFYKRFLAPEEEESEKKRKEEFVLSGKFDNPRLIRAILENFEIDSDGRLNQHQGWVYDASTRQWVRSKNYVPRREVVSKNTHTLWDAYEQADHQSQDPTRMPARRKQADSHHQAYLDELPDDDQQAIINSALAVMHAETTTSVIRAVGDAIVTCIAHGGVSHLRGICMKENLILVPAHLANFGDKISVLRGERSYRAIILAKHADKDVMLLKVVDPKWKPVKDITSYLADRNGLELERAGAMMIPSRETHDLHYGNLVWDFRGVLGHCEAFVRDILRICWATNKPLTRAGDCGAPVFLATRTRGARILAGMHSFATHSSCSAGCIILHKDLWDELTTTHELATTPFQPTDFCGHRVEERLKGLFTQELPIVNPGAIPNNDRLHLIGRYSGIFTASNNKTSYVASPDLRGQARKIPAFCPPGTISPSVEYPKDINGKPNRAYKQLIKMAIREPELDPEIAKMVEDGITQHYLDLINTEEARVLTNHEVVNGVSAGALNGVNGLDMTTSVGFTLKKLFGVKKKGDLFFFDGVYKPKDIPATRYLYTYIEDVENGGEVLSWPTVATLKDELLPSKSVIQDGKIRLFSNCDMMQLFMDKKYLGWCMAFAHNHLHETHLTVGMNPYVDFHALYVSLSEHPHMWTGDYKGWDKKIPLRIMELGARALVRVASALFTPSEVSVMQQLLHYDCHRMEVLNDTLFKIDGSMSSGIWLTNFGNSLFNFAVRTYCIMSEFRDQGRTVPRMCDILLHCTLRDHGDDEINSCSQEYSEIVDYFSMKHQKARLGLQVTPATKDGEEVPFEDPMETSFISRFPKRLGNHIYGALKKESIEQQLDYTRQLTVSEFELLYDSILQEAALWGDEYFTKIRTRVVSLKRLRNLNFQATPDFETCIAALMTAAGQVQLSARTGAKDKSYHQASFKDDKMRFECDKGCSELFRGDETVDQHIANCSGKMSVSFTGSPTTSKEMEHAVLSLTNRVDITKHIIDVDKHRKQVTRCGLKFFNEGYALHDLSKYSPVEAIGYQLRFMRGVDGEIWRFSLWHHYAYNDHHPVDIYPLEEFMASGRPKHWTEAMGPIGDETIQEMIADGCACILRGRPTLTPEEALAIYAEQAEARNPITGPYPEAIFRRLERIAKETLDRLSATPKVTTYQAGDLTFTDFSKYLNYLRNSKKITNCPSCDGLLPIHDVNCEINLTMKCHYCPYTNTDRQKIVNHCKSVHPAKEPQWNEVHKDAVHQSNVNQMAAPVAMGNSVISRSGEPPQVAKVDVINTVPAFATLLPGFATEMVELMHQPMEIAYLNIVSTATRGSVIAKYGYAELASMNKPAGVYGSYHRYFSGTMNIQFQLFGAANKTGSILLGWVPNILEDYSIEEIHAYGHYTSITMTEQAHSTISLGNTDTQLQPREVISGTDIATPRPGVIALIEEPVANSLGTGDTTVNAQIKAFLGPDAAFSYVKVPSLSQPFERYGSGSTILDVTKLLSASSLYLMIDGPFYQDRLKGLSIHVTPPPIRDELEVNVGKRGKRANHDLIPSISEVSSFYRCDPQVGAKGFVSMVYGDVPLALLEGPTAHTMRFEDPATWPGVRYVSTAVLPDVGAGSTLMDEGAAFLIATDTGTFVLIRHRTHNGYSPDDKEYPRYAAQIFPNKFESLLGNINPRRDLRGLKRLSFQDTPVLLYTNNSTYSYPMQSSMTLDDTLAYHVRKVTTGNALLSVRVGSVDLGEVLYDSDNEGFWINYQGSNYAHLKTDGQKVTITAITTVTRTTLPKPATASAFIPNEPAPSSSRFSPSDRNYHQAGLGVAAGLFGAGMGLNFMGDLGHMIGTGVTSAKNRALARELAQMSMDFGKEQGKYNRMAGLGGIVLNGALEQKLARSKAGYNNIAVASQVTGRSTGLGKSTSGDVWDKHLEDKGLRPAPPKGKREVPPPTAEGYDYTNSASLSHRGPEERFRPMLQKGNSKPNMKSRRPGFKDKAETVAPQAPREPARPITPGGPAARFIKGSKGKFVPGETLRPGNVEKSLWTEQPAVFDFNNPNAPLPKPSDGGWPEDDDEDPFGEQGSSASAQLPLAEAMPNPERPRIAARRRNGQNNNATQVAPQETPDGATALPESTEDTLENAVGRPEAGPEQEQSSQGEQDITYEDEDEERPSFQT
jgi:hypothetical protein